MILGYTENPQVTTGSFATVNDPRNTNQPNNGATNPLGILASNQDSSGRWQYYRYVRLNTTTPTTTLVGPVYWKDNTKQVVTTTMSDSLTALANSVAGVLLFGALATAGNFFWIQVGGYLAAMPVVASTVKSDILIGATGDQITARVAAGTASTNRPLAIALTDRTGGGASDLEIVVENF